MSSQHGKFKNMWEMRQPGIFSKKPVEIFKCTECGAETHPANGHNGEPDVHRCLPGCRCKSKKVVHRRCFGDEFNDIEFCGIDVPMGPGDNPVKTAMDNFSKHYYEVFGKK
jgi:hypothetical protein